MRPDTMRILALFLLVGCQPGTIGGAADPGSVGGEGEAEGQGGVTGGRDGGGGGGADGGWIADWGAGGTDDPEWPEEELLPAQFLTPSHVTMVDDTSVVVSWQGASETAAVVRYGIDPEDLHAVDSPSGTEHHVVLESLRPGTGYFYEVEVEGAVRKGVFVTPGSPTVRIVHLGEFHAPSESESAGAFASVIRDFRPHLIVESGDMVDDGEDMNHWTDYQRTSAAWISNAILLPAHSNHVGDGEGISNMMSLFDMDSLWYSTRYGPVEVLSIRSDYFDEFDEQEAPWIREAASLAHDGVDDPAFLLAAWHHPACSSNYSSRADSREWVMENIIDNLVEGGGVDMVLVGHDKYYERSTIEVMGAPSPIVHVMTNIGKISPGDPGDNHFKCTTEATELDDNSTLLIEVNEDVLHARAVRSDGSLIDEFEIVR